MVIFDFNLKPSSSIVQNITQQEGKSFTQLSPIKS